MSTRTGGYSVLNFVGQVLGGLAAGGLALFAVWFDRRLKAKDTAAAEQRASEAQGEDLIRQVNAGVDDVEVRRESLVLLAWAGRATTPAERLTVCLRFAERAEDLRQTMLGLKALCFEVSGHPTAIARYKAADHLTVDRLGAIVIGWDGLWRAIEAVQFALVAEPPPSAVRQETRTADKRLAAAITALKELEHFPRLDAA